MATINQYYGIASCSNGQWLTGDSFAFVSSESGVNQLWKMNGKEKEQLSFAQERVWSYAVAPNGADIYFTMDNGGNEQEQIHFLKAGAKESINLTHNDAARYQWGGVKPDGKTIVYACNARNPKNFDLCQMDVATQTSEIIYENTDSYNTPAALSPDGRYLLYNKLKGQSDNCLWILDLDTKQTRNIDTKGTFAQYTSPTWKSDSSGFYFATDVDSQFKYIAYYCVASGEIHKVYGENWDVEALALSGDDCYLAAEINRDGCSVLRIMDTRSGNFLSIPTPPMGVMGGYGLHWAKESHRLLFSLTSGKRPLDVWELDVDADRLLRRTNAPMAGVDRDEMVEPTLHHYQSFDGLNVPYWFYQTPVKTQGVQPVVLSIHGGPEGQDRPNFRPLLQYLLSQGLSIIAPNVRGSVGYGKDYHHLDDVEKRLDSVHDVQCLVAHLLEQKMAQADKIAVMGASYGGYMTLSCITAYPDLWAAAVDTVGMSNLVTFLENTADYRRAHRESEYGSLSQHRDVLKRVSPIHGVDKITAPLMVVHGANDPRVPVGEAEQIVDSLKARGVPVKYLRYEDEGHGLAKRKNQLDCYPQVCAFLKEHLGLTK